MKVLTSTNIASEFGPKIKELGYEVVTFNNDNVNEKDDYGEDIILASIEMEGMDLSNHKNLKYIFTITVGIDYLDLDYLQDNNIVLTNNNGVYSEPIAEWIVYSLLQVEKLDRLNIKNQENKIWKKRGMSYNLYNKKALFLGTGSIAQAGAKRLSGFDMKINGFNTDGRKIEPFNNVYSLEELDDVIQEMDYIIMCLPHTDGTYHFLNEERISKMKDKVVIVNISRGSTIDENALIKALKSGKVKGAALDVFENEPLDKNSPLWEMDNVYVYPHISFSSEDYKEREFRSALHNLKSLNGESDLINIIDYERGY